MSTTINLNLDRDSVVSTQKITSGYFTGDAGQLNSDSIYTMSLADSNESYYFNIGNKHPLSSSATTQFSIAYGHVGGSGSNVEAGTIGETEAIYRQWATTVLAENEVTGGFVFNTSDGRESQIYVLVGKRALYKDRINKKNWTIAMSGSISQHGASGSKILYLTDDSDTVQATHTVAGPRYNIVSGTDGSVAVAATTTTYGWFYPEIGTLIFAGSKLSASIPGAAASGGAAAVYDETHNNAWRGFGFTESSTANKDYQNGLRFVNCLSKNSFGSNAYMKFRSEEDQNSRSYFCRIFANQMNFSNSPTFVSGSNQELRHRSMWGNPTVYVTGIGLYDSAGTVVAIGKVSSPIKKNFSSEATIKVKLTY